ncbi:lasso RiPP family leader peptide-containing protein [Streptomyces daliensis]|uniref:Lasso RiPP family leader peptide-containing protein n=1 Tax=Streptomyces daliensis TaxID=299421 RepID=A0A8T4IP37_9ACTN|nr:lasso RiPP family leader peptide-containing protein [Streptomyces daliensis]
MSTKNHYEIPTLIEIGEFSEKTRWVGGWIPDLFLGYSF